MYLWLILDKFSTIVTSFLFCGEDNSYFFNLGNELYRSHYKINVHATHSRLFHSQIVFSRPIRWILALLGDFVVPFYFAGISRYYILY